MAQTQPEKKFVVSSQWICTLRPQGPQMEHKQQTTRKVVNIFIILWPGAKFMNIRQMTEEPKCTTTAQ